MKALSVLSFLLLWHNGLSTNEGNATNLSLPKPKIRQVHVNTDINYRYARTTIQSKVLNPANISQEATFSVTLPESAFVTEFKILVNDQVYNAYVKEKEAARQEYADAVTQGRTAAHLAVNTRDSKTFTVSLNLEPEQKVGFVLTYEELLERKLGVYKHVINLDPGQIVQDLKVVVKINEASNITKLHVPELATANEISDNGTTNALASVQRPKPQNAVVTFSPTPEQQVELASEGIKGQLVVEYDVDRSQSSGQVLMKDGYFVHFFTPEDLPPLRKHVTFVLDVSGSMSGRKMIQLTQAMDTILGEMNQNDSFSIAIFSSSVQVWDYNHTGALMFERIGRLQGMRWGDYDEDEEETAILNRHVVATATAENVTSAKQFIGMVRPGGATNINDALLKGLDLSKLAISRHNSTQAENNDLQSAVERPQPILIFLTDGKANVGVQNLETIIRNVENANTGNCSIFSLALGKEADFSFLKKLSLRNFGFARKIYEASDTALQLRDFYRQVASPLLSLVSFKYQDDQVQKNTVTRKKYNIMFLGSELVVAGKLVQDAFTLIVVQGFSVRGRATYSFAPTTLPDTVESTNTTTNTNTTVGFMEKMWAYLTIHQLLEKKESKTNESASSSSEEDSDESKEDNNNQTALDLALKYSFVTPLTSLVVVKPNNTDVVDTKDASEFGNEIETGGTGPLRSRSPGVSPPSGASGTKMLGQDHVHRTKTANSSRPTLAAINDVTWIPSNNSIVLQPTINGTTEVFQIAGADQANVSNATCTTPLETAGHCRHFRHCVLSSFLSSQQDFLPYFCRIDNFLGVCCPEYLQPVSS